VRIKICGITRRDDAELALSLGADAVGCVFYSGSSRGITVQQAVEVSLGISGLGMLVGLFVNPSKREVEEVLASVPLHCLQFHGTESPAFCRQFQRPYIKAVPMSQGIDLNKVDGDFAGASALLLDSARGGQFGGSGESFDWDWVGPGMGHRVILAGGLAADNVASAIKRVRPAAVDVSSGVESAKGIKDAEKMRTFIQSARVAAQGLGL
jgi:phosphoribosylanthranilate isomerase